MGAPKLLNMLKVSISNELKRFGGRRRWRSSPRPITHLFRDRVRVTDFGSVSSARGAFSELAAAYELCRLPFPSVFSFWGVYKLILTIGE